jgi:hypothetical protein
MRGFLAAALLFISLVGIAGAQGMPDTTPPAELKAVDFLVGNFKGEATFYFGPSKMTSTCTAKGERALNGRYIHTMIGYEMKMQGMPNSIIQGMHMLTYDPQAKQYVAYWFDGTVSYAMHMVGNFDGNKLVMISDPTATEPGGPVGIMRSTWWKTDKGAGFSLEVKQGDNWSTMMDGTFEKK